MFIYTKLLLLVDKFKTIIIKKPQGRQQIKFQRFNKLIFVYNIFVIKFVGWNEFEKKKQN